ncbi:diacylglycerol kinase (CTP) [Malassezia psittaci]|uniref:Diacylglycerol kinase (CTP) n=1 Tax=Malassezia psittaci TaxID=1821823 RepID=A0AAF0FHQ1_9BASI|nr:diacylglycerol kinase (CTP) [Malassezia psittaci]
MAGAASQGHAGPQRSNSLEKGAAVLRALGRTRSYQEATESMPDDVATATDSVATDIPVQASEPRKPVRVARPISSEKWEKYVVEWEIPRKLLHVSIGFVVLFLYETQADLSKIVRVLGTMLAVIVSADLLRLNSASFEAFYERVLGVLMRDGEKERVNGVVWYIVGVLLSLHFFPEDIACVSVMILSWCDPSASTLGRLYGRYTPSMPPPLFAPRKSFAGFVAASVMGALTTYLFWGTSIAIRGERASGLSWTQNGAATFGTKLAPGFLHSGWTGFATGFQSQTNTTLWEKTQAVSEGRAAMPAWLLYAASGLIAGVTESLDLGGCDDNLFIPLLSGLGLWMTFWVWGLLCA